jgi:hypothetical protein
MRRIFRNFIVVFPVAQCAPISALCPEFPSPLRSFSRKVVLRSVFRGEHNSQNKRKDCSSSWPADRVRFDPRSFEHQGQWRAATVGIIRYDPRRDSQGISRQTHPEARRFAPKHLCRSVKKLVRALVAFSSFPDLVNKVRYLIMKLS